MSACLRVDRTDNSSGTSESIIMKSTSRFLAVVGTLLPLALFFLPMWRIDLGAPQYPPPGLGIRIHIDRVEGAEPNDLANINNLNHYIGMKRIEPDAIPELDIMPWVVGVMSALGVVVGLFGRRRLLVAWIVLMAIAGGIGLYDFYKWEYDYGHDLDPHAIIKIEGMNYQPPLIGTKVLLNFTATSLPDTGFYVMSVGVVLVAVSVYTSRPRKS